MLDKYLIEHCSPTLASIKTASLFSVNLDETSLKSNLDKWNEILDFKGVKIVLLRQTKHRALIYVYRENMLEKDLKNPSVSVFLKEHGYRRNNVFEDIEYLKYKLKNNLDFPHEIGLFLGYPLEDVTGFIENKGKNCKCGGYWKVYGNVMERKKAFARFSKCSDIYKRMFRQGKTVGQLTVAV